jgi:hypothetical protein
VEVNAQTLRRWLLAAGLWSQARKRRVHRKRRERKEHVGELNLSCGGTIAGVDPRARHPGGAVYGWEERVPTRSWQRGAVGGSGAGDSIWADVPALGIRIIAANSPQAGGGPEIPSQSISQPGITVEPSAGRVATRFE